MNKFLLITTVLLTSIFSTANASELDPKERLGEFIFFDQALSINKNQACAACHDPEVGWTGPNSTFNAHGAVYEGSIPGGFGNRKPPSSAYATPSPILHLINRRGDFVGGNFWDGRATGEKLGNPAADQAQGPFLNPVEHALPDSACVVERVCNSLTYPDFFTSVWGTGACDISWPADINTQCASIDGMVMLPDDERAKSDLAYDYIALSIAAYEDSSVVNQFTSKFDSFLERSVRLSAQERRGMRLFNGKGKCARCHTSGMMRRGGKPLFTDFTYDNLGVPRNPENPFYTQLEFNPMGMDWVDLGLGGFLESRVDYQQYAPQNYGKQKVPTLRNVDKRPYPEFVKAFSHNGYFKSLKSIVHFYNTRDVKPRCSDPFTTEAQALAQGCWPEPEVPNNVNTAELGDLKLTDAEEDAIVAFMKTLSDGYMEVSTSDDDNSDDDDDDDDDND